MAGNEVLISSLSKRFVSLERGLLAAASFFIRALRKDKVGLEIFLVSEKDMFVMNREYRGKNFPTNVLAFEEPKNFPSRKKGINTYIYKGTRRGHRIHAFTWNTAPYRF